MLMRIFGKSGKVAGSRPEIDECDFVEDLSSWEFVVPSDADDDHETYSLNDEDDVEIGIEAEDTVGEIGLKQDDSCLLGSPSSDFSIGSPLPAQITVPLEVASVGLNDYKTDHGYGSDYDIDNKEKEKEEEEEEVYDDGDDYDDGLDEELVAYCERNNFGKQRMKKLSKKTSPRMNKLNNLKRSPYYYSRGAGTMCKLRG